MQDPLSRADWREDTVQERLDRALLYIAGLIHRCTSAAWERECREVEFGDLRADVRHLREEVARRDEVIELYRTRFGRVPAGSRPHYPPFARFAILWHVRRWGLTTAEAARTFMVAPTTIARWFAEIESGDSRLAAPPSPLNRLPDLTRELVRRLFLEQASWGTRRVCDALVRLGLKLSRASVQRIRREGPPRKPRPRPDRTALGRPVVAREPRHVWMADLTTVSLLGLRRIWISAVLDAFSRRILAIRAFARVPRARDVRQMPREAFAEFGTPKYLVTDRGCQFKAGALSKFLKRRGVRRRYGAVARWQSVAVIDRFFGSLKREYASRWWALLSLERVNRALHDYTEWFGRHRAHQGLGGRTPDEVYYRRRCRRVGEIRDVRLTHFRGDPKLPIYRRVLAA